VGLTLLVIGMPPNKIMMAVRPTIPRDRDHLAQAIALANDLPPLSPLARHLLSTMSSPGEGPSLAEVASWIEKDTMTSGKVLALANSALYGRLVPTLSVRKAVMRLGINPLRNLIFHESMTKVWSHLPTPAQWSSIRFNTHSIATAVFCEIIASALAPEHMELSFLAGMFHDTGRLIIAVLLRDNLELLEELNRHEHQDLEAVEKELVGFTHSEVSAIVARSWNLPTSIETGVRYHENPNLDPARDESHKILLSHIVNAADWCVDCQGFSISGAHKEEDDKLRILRQFGPVFEDSGVLERFESELEILLDIL
jgi:HD-like signal output (HDOD) protein